VFFKGFLGTFQGFQGVRVQALSHHSPLSFLLRYKKRRPPIIIVPAQSYPFCGARTGGLKGKNGITLSQAIEGYFIAARARRLSENTLVSYDYAFQKFEAFLGEDPAVTAITPSDIREFLNSLDGLAPKSVLNHHIALSALWTWAVEESVAERYVVREVRLPRPDRREIMPYTESDVKAMLQACDRTRGYAPTGAKCDNLPPTALRDRAIITLLVDTGIRATEFCELRIYQADLRNHRITVMGKGRKERMMPISARTAQLLWRYSVERGEDRKAAPLFVNRYGRPLERNTLRRLLQRVGDRAGVHGANCHRFRHTFAIQFLRNSGHVYAGQRMPGHSTLETVKRYLATVQGDLERAHQDAGPVANWLL
jgi:integrase/recombinase XerD